MTTEEFKQKIRKIMEAEQESFVAEIDRLKDHAKIWEKGYQTGIKNKTNL